MSSSRLDAGACAVGADLVDGAMCLAAVAPGASTPPLAPAGADPDASCFFVDADGRAWMGGAARRRSLQDPAHGLWRPFSALLGALPPDDDLLHPFARPRAGEGGAEVTLRGRPRRLATVLTVLLRQLAERATAELSDPPRDAVLAHPGWIGTRLREDLAQVGRAAGFERVHLVDRATAAAVALESAGQRGRIGIVRLERCGVDVAIADLSDDTVELRASASRPVASSCDPVARLAQRMIESFLERNEGRAVVADGALARVHDAAERAIAQIAAGGGAVPVALPYIDDGAPRSPHLMDHVGGSALERFVEPYGELLRDVIGDLLSNAPAGAVDRWIVLGDLAGIAPFVRALSDATGADVERPDDVARLPLRGVLRQASRRAGLDDGMLFVLPAAPHAVALRVGEGDPLLTVERGTTLPARVSHRLELEDGASRLMVEVVERGGASERGEHDPRPAVHVLEPPAGLSAVELVLEVDEDGIVEVGALDPASGDHQTLPRVDAVEPRDGAGASELMSDEALALARPLERHHKLREARFGLASELDRLGRDAWLEHGAGDAVHRAAVAGLTALARTALADVDVEAMREAGRRIERLVPPVRR